MGNVLLIVPPGVRPRAARAQALALAEQSGGALIAVALLDPGETARIAATLDSAFMGERVSDRVVEVLAREQRNQGEALLTEIGEAAAARGVPFTPVVDSGDPDEVCPRLVRQHGVSDAVLAVEKRSWVSRLLARSAGVHVPAIASCRLTVVEETGGDG